MLISKSLVLGVMCCIAVSGLLVAQETPAAPSHTNFSGRWRMEKDQSDFAKFKMPDIVVRVVDQHDSTMNIHTVQTTGTKTSVADVSYFTDGSITKNVINGRDAESKTFWDGPTLVVRTSMKDSKGEDELILDRWDLSADGNTLITTSHIETPRGQVYMKMVCLREKPGS